MDRRPVLTAVALAATGVLMSCGKKEEAQETEVAVKEDAPSAEKELTPGERPYEIEGGTAKKRTIIIDAVTGEKILAGEIPYSYLYKGKTYSFKTEENMLLFKQDPLKYIDKSE